MADKMGKKDIAASYYKRAGYYKNLYDSTTRQMRGKDSKGNWRKDFNPLMAHNFPWTIPVIIRKPMPGNISGRRHSMMWKAWPVCWAAGNGLRINSTVSLPSAPQTPISIWGRRRWSASMPMATSPVTILRICMPFQTSPKERESWSRRSVVIFIPTAAPAWSAMMIAGRWVPGTFCHIGILSCQSIQRGYVIGKPRVQAATVYLDKQKPLG